MKLLLKILLSLFPIISYGQDSLQLKRIDATVSIIDSDLTLQKKVVSDTETMMIDTTFSDDMIGHFRYNFLIIELYSNTAKEIKKMVYLPQKSNQYCPVPKCTFYFDHSRVIKAVILDYMIMPPNPRVYYFDSIIYYTDGQRIKVTDKRDPINPVYLSDIFRRFINK